ncbi:MAG: hypothetical protein J6S83_05625 [Lachnospiraceae bacterium]|nr:hypothetical protein [Lachnospiraceae bacterium]
MDTTSMMGLMDLIVVGAGVYVIYGWYMLVFKNEIKQGLVISKAQDPKKCKDLEGFKSYIGPRLLIFGLAAVLSGGVGLFQSYVAPLPGIVYWIFYMIFVAVIVWFTVCTRKAGRIFF